METEDGVGQRLPHAIWVGIVYGNTTVSNTRLNGKSVMINRNSLGNVFLSMRISLKAPEYTRGT